MTHDSNVGKLRVFVFAVLSLVVGVGYAPVTVRAQAPSQQGTNVARKAYPTGDVATSVILLERVMPAEVRRGQMFEYSIRLKNLTAADVENVVLTEQLHSAFELNATAPAADRADGAKLAGNRGALAPKADKIVRIKGTTNRVGELASCATVTFNTNLCASVHVVQPELELVKTAPAEALLCDTIPLSFVIKNRGSGVAKNVKVTDQLPDGWATEQGRSGIVFEAGDLAGGQSRRFTAEVKSSTTGEFVNRASATEQGGLTAEAQATTRVSKPELTLTKTGPDVRYIGRPATFEMTVTNTGGAPARDTILVDTLPAGAAFVRASDGGRDAGGRVTWALGTMAPGTSRKVSVTVNPTKIGMLRNTAVAEAYCARADATTQLEARGIPAILLEVVDLADPIEVNANETYEVTVLNQGSAPDTNIVITCVLPEQQTFVAGDGPTQARAEGKTVTFAPLPSLAPKATAKYRVVVKGVGVGDVRFSVSMSSDQLETPVQETESTNIY